MTVGEKLNSSKIIAFLFLKKVFIETLSRSVRPQFQQISLTRNAIPLQDYFPHGQIFTIIQHFLSMEEEVGRRIFPFPFRNDTFFFFCLPSPHDAKRPPTTDIHRPSSGSPWMSRGGDHHFGPPFFWSGQRNGTVAGRAMPFPPSSLLPRPSLFLDSLRFPWARWAPPRLLLRIFLFLLPLPLPCYNSGTNFCHVSLTLARSDVPLFSRLRI